MQRDDIRILGEISRLITEYDDPDKIFAKMVRRIAQRLKVDVCSIYLISDNNKQLTLRATHGLNNSVIGQLKMDLDEGLSGLVIEQMKYVFAVNPKQHPRFKYCEESGEEKYQTYLGLPLEYRNDPLGVLVVQTFNIDGLKSEDINVFSTIAIQISTAVVFSGLLDRIKPQKKEITSTKPQQILRGTAVSPGIVKGYVHYFGDKFGFDMVDFERTDNVQNEINRLDLAFSQVLLEINNLSARVQDISGQKDAIVEAHIMLLNDPALKQKVVLQIKEQNLRATYALKKVVENYLDLFSQMSDAYLRERAADLEDIGRRILGHLLGVKSSRVGTLSKDTVLITSDLSPIDLVSMKQDRLKAIVLSKGGRTSHAVILSKSFGIPMVIGVEGILDAVKEDDYIIVDGHTGLVFKDPPQSIIEDYDRLIRIHERQTLERKDASRAPAKTRDGFTVHTGANIGMLADIAMMERHGGDHIGLFRTEFPFLISKRSPSEEAQFDLYQSIIMGAQGRPVTIRTLDVGGDKFLSYLDYPKEDNPFLGWRSIRVSLELKDIFKTQIRAILRAATTGDVRILFPMVSSIGEIRQIIQMMDQVKQDLHDEKVDFKPNIPLGIMVEVPGIVRILDRVLKYVDFISIGTNDLIQYMLAVDRNNLKVSRLYDPFHPSVIEIIQDIAKQCQAASKAVSICGESAANVLCAYLFIGMGIDTLSMSPVSVPDVRNMIAEINQKDAQLHLQEVLKMEDGSEIREYLETVLWEWVK